MISYRVVPAGDSALPIEFEERIDPAVNARAIALADAVQAAGLAGVRDVVPTFRSVAVFFDPVHTDGAALLACIDRHAQAPSAAAVESREPIRIPVATAATSGRTSAKSPHLRA